MNQEYKHRILNHLDFLVKNTLNLSVLLSLLKEGRVLSEGEIQTLVSQPTDIKRHTSLYNTLVNKGDKEFRLLLRYLERSDNERIVTQLWDNPSPLYPNMDRSTYLKWQSIITKLIEIPEAGQKVKIALNIMSFFDPEKIDTSFVAEILNAWPTNEIEQNPCQNVKHDDIFELLNISAICERKELDNVVYISLQPFIQDICRVNMEDEETLTETMSKTIQTIDSIFDHAVTSEELIHIKTLLGQATSKTDTTALNNYSSLFDKTAKKYYNRGLFREGYEFNCQAISALTSVFGPESQETLRMMCWKGGNMMELGEHENALKILLQTLETQKKVLGEEHDHTLRTAADVGLAFYRAGNYDEALKWLNDSLDKREKFENKENVREALGIKDDIANILKAQGKYTESLEMFQQLLIQKKQLLGKHHPSTLTTKLNLGNLYDRQGKFEDASKIFVDVLEARKSRLGNDHPKTLICKHHIGNLYERLAKYDDALKTYRELMESQEHVFGRQHPSVMTTLQNIGNVYTRQGKYDEAMKIFFEVLEFREKTLGKSHPNTLGTKFNIGYVYACQKKYDDALRVFEELLEIRQKVLGHEHPGTLSTKQSIGYVFAGQEKFDDAMKMYTEVMSDQELTLGKEHPSTLTTMYNIGKLFEKTGKNDEALKYFTEVLEKRERIFGKDHPNVVRTKTRILNIQENLNMLTA